VLGTIHYETGSSSRTASLTTPAAVELQELLADARDADRRNVVMEVSSHALAQHRVHAVEFDVACFTNITHDHLDFHGDMKSYAAAKARLLRHLKRWGTAVLNADDATVCLLAEELPDDAHVMWFSVKPRARADLTVSLETMAADGSTFILHTPKGSVSIQTKLMGGHNISNVLAAVGCALAMGVSLSAIRDGLRRLDGVPGRLERVDVSGGVTAVVDYAHTPDAMRRVLAHVRPLVRGRLITVFGCGGDRDRAKRSFMGRAASDWSDEVVLTTDNPRGEDPSRIVSDILSGMGGNATLSHEVDRGAAIRSALETATQGDWVLVLGKGHETTLKLATGSVPFDDRQVIREWETTSSTQRAMGGVV
jgi:UDP-N-acetylmuramoyl-L-alanyl-D-glutamate--2,6-diaminopimelate ligase